MIALYRKYRPQVFAEVVGQTTAKQTLQNALKLDRIVHSYLFAGPRGTGKTTMARIFAKALNCENRKPGEMEPCNQCPTCQAINDNAFVDLVEIDAASNRGIDEIRNLKESVRFAPSKRDGYKVYIIDESHMLTKDASNALLKTLEEPPKNVVFILATTDPHKMLPTIHSRVQRFDFSSLSASELREKLERITQKEAVTVAPEVINRIVLGAMGGARDAESLLGKVLSFADQEITPEIAEQILGKDATGASMEILDHIAQNRAAQAIQTIQTVYQDGYRLETVVHRLIDRTRAVFLQSISPDLVSTLDFLPEELDQIQHLAKAQSTETWGRLLTQLEHRKAELETAYLPTIPLELAIVEACITKTSLELSLSEIPATPVQNVTLSDSPVAPQPQSKPAKTSQPAPQQRPVPTPPPAKAAASNPFRSQAKPAPTPEPTPEPAIPQPEPQANPQVENPAPAPTHSDITAEIDLYQVKQSVDSVARVLGKESKSLVPLFTKSKILRAQAGVIYMESQTAFYKSRLEKNAQIIASAFETVLQVTPLKVEVVEPGTMAADPVSIPDDVKQAQQAKAPTPLPKEEVIPDLPDEPTKSVEDSVSDIFKEFM